MNNKPPIVRVEPSIQQSTESPHVHLRCPDFREKGHTETTTQGKSVSFGQQVDHVVSKLRTAGRSRSQ